MVDGADCRLDQRAAGAAGQTGTSSAVFAGPGAGIALSGLLAVYIQAKSLSAGAAWQIYGVLALVLIVLVARYLPRAGQLHRPGTAPEPLLLTADLRRLVWSYSLAGSAISSRRPFYRKWRRAFPGSLFAQFVWPIFGAASVVGIALSIALRHTSIANRRLAIVLWLQGIGVLAAWLLPGIGGLLTGGGCWWAAGPLRRAALSSVRSRAGARPHALHGGLLTTGYAIGQLVGPVTSALSTWLTHRLEPALGLAGMRCSLAER
ncbi:YbfB/YjiJ family MFS transporter [Enterobacter hormaechei]